MLKCIACSKQINNNNGSVGRQQDEDTLETPRTRQAIKALTSQIKEIALKASGAYKSCKPCSGSSNHNRNNADSDAASDSAQFHCPYRRARSSTPRIWGKEMESRLKGLSSEDGTPTSVSGRAESVVFMKEDEPKEWVAQVEPGVLITFLSLPEGGNDLKRIRFSNIKGFKKCLLHMQCRYMQFPLVVREFAGEIYIALVTVAIQAFSREMFNKWQAQRWWFENHDKVMELYNVQLFNQQAVPLSTPPRSEDEGSRVESAKDSPVTPPLNKEQPRNFVRSTASSDSLDHQPVQPHQYYDSSALASTPKLSSTSGAKTEILSVDGSVRSSSSREPSISNASDIETEWVEQDEPGVYLTIRALPGGSRELRRVRFSREKFGETQARIWWEENRGRIQQHYLL